MWVHMVEERVVSFSALSSVHAVTAGADTITDLKFEAGAADTRVMSLGKGARPHKTPLIHHI